MLGRSLFFTVAILACLAGLLAPLLVDARHWWPRKPKRWTWVKSPAFASCGRTGTQVTC